MIYLFIFCAILNLSFEGLMIGSFSGKLASYCMMLFSKTVITS